MELPTYVPFGVSLLFGQE